MMEITTTFYDALKIMGIGMTGIFVFMLSFGIIILALQKAFSVEDEPKVGENVE